MKRICFWIVFIGMGLSPVIPPMAVYAADTDIQFNEIMYNPSGDDTNREWIEIVNTGSGNVDLSGWKFYEAGTNHGMTAYSSQPAPNNDAILDPGEFAVIVEDASVFLTDYPSYTDTIFDSSFSLNNSGEPLELKSSAGGPVIDSVDYSDKLVTEGRSAEKKYPSLLSSDPDYWGESTVDGGTPGAQNSIFDASLPVQLSGFWAFRSGGVVTLKWRTESEVNHLGWNLYRRDLNDDTFTRINQDVILGAGNTPTSHTYQFTDRSAQPNKQYEYYLEEIDIFGKHSQSQIIDLVEKLPHRLALTWGDLKVNY